MAGTAPAAVILAIVGGLVVGTVPQPGPDPIAAVSSGAEATAVPDTSIPTPLPFDEVETRAPAFALDLSKSIAWPARSVLFEADRLQIKVRGKTFTGGDPEIVRSWASIDQRDFDIEWYENGVLMRMNIQIKSDGSEYWMQDFMVYDGSRGEGRWVSWEGPLYPTPLDRPMEAGLRLSGGQGRVDAEVAIDGIRITAFHPGSGPGPLTGCEAPMPLDDDVRFAMFMEEQPTRENDAQDLERFLSRSSRSPPTKSSALNSAWGRGRPVSRSTGNSSRLRLRKPA